MNKIKFDLEEFKKEFIAINCQTEKEAREFLKYLDSKGLQWCDDSSLLEETEWEDYEEKTCYTYNDDSIIYCPADYCKMQDYTIIPYLFLEFPKEEQTQTKESTTKPILKSFGSVDILGIHCDIKLYKYGLFDGYKKIFYVNEKETLHNLRSSIRKNVIETYISLCHVDNAKKYDLLVTHWENINETTEVIFKRVCNYFIEKEED